MRCPYYVVYSVSNKGKTTPAAWGDTVKLAKHNALMAYGGKKTLLEPIACEGHITAKVEAIDEPDWGDHHAGLEISYRCDTCGRCFTYDDKFPYSAESLSEILTKYIENLPERNE